MKSRKAKDLADLPVADLAEQLKEAEETLAKQTFQHSLKQLHDTTYLRILRRDIARMKTVMNQKNSNQS